MQESPATFGASGARLRWASDRAATLRLCQMLLSLPISAYVQQSEQCASSPCSPWRMGCVGECLRACFCEQLPQIAESVSWVRPWPCAQPTLRPT